MGYFSGQGLSREAQRLLQSGGKPNLLQRAALKCGKAAPYVWAVAGAAGGATAASTLHPAIVAGVFARKGAVAGALFLGSRS